MGLHRRPLQLPRRILVDDRVVTLALGDPRAGSPGLTGLLDPAISRLSMLAELSLVPVPNSGAGRALYADPIRILHPVTRDPLPFSTFFSFFIANLNHSSIGSGLAFLLSPDDRSLSDAGGFLGLIKVVDPNSATIAVEFDTLMDVEFEDINGNHVGDGLEEGRMERRRERATWSVESPKEEDAEKRREAARHAAGMSERWMSLGCERRRGWGLEIFVRDWGEKFQGKRWGLFRRGNFGKKIGLEGLRLSIN